MQYDAPRRQDPRGHEKQNLVLIHDVMQDQHTEVPTHMKIHIENSRRRWYHGSNSKTVPDMSVSTDQLYVLTLEAEDFLGML
jgi:hypothetical protein